MKASNGLGHFTFADGNPSFCPTRDAVRRTPSEKNEHPEFAPKHTLHHSDVTTKLSNTRMYDFGRPLLQNTNFPKHAAHGTGSGPPPATGPRSAEEM